MRSRHSPSLPLYLYSASVCCSEAAPRPDDVGCSWTRLRQRLVDLAATYAFHDRATALAVWACFSGQLARAGAARADRLAGRGGALRCLVRRLHVGRLLAH